jgi:hydroxymethylglutaryl-CoA synthase
MAGIASVGWALPRLAIKADEYRKSAGSFAARGVLEKTVAAFDEDELTLAVEAANRALAAAHLPPEQVGFLAFASVGAQPGSASVGAVALGVSAGPAVDFLGSGPPFAAALQAAAESAEATGRPSLVAAADALRARLDDTAEHPLGAAGAAFVITKSGGAQLVGSAFASSAALEGSRLGPDGLVRSVAGDDPSAPALRLALTRLFAGGFAAESFDLFVGTERGGGSMVAAHSPEKLPADALPAPVFPRTGDTGAASAALALIDGLENAQSGDQLLLADAEGASGAALAFKVGPRPAGEESFRSSLTQPRVHLSWHGYLGHRRYLPDPLPTHTKSEGAYISPAGWEETLEARLRLLASRCKSCGVGRHPPREVCPDCGGSDLEVFRARGEGAVHALTRISRGGAPSEFALQQTLVGEYTVVVVDLVDGLRTVAQVAAGSTQEAGIGRPVTLRLRRLFEQEGRVRYGLKGVLDAGEAHAPARKV